MFKCPPQCTHDNSEHECLGVPDQVTTRLGDQAAVVKNFEPAQSPPPKTKGRSLQAALADPSPEPLLLKRNHPKRPSQVVPRTGSKKQLARRSVGRCPPTKSNSPQLVDHNRLSAGIPQRADKFSRRDVEGVDRPAVGVIRNQQRVTKGSKVLRRHSESPGLVQRRAFNQPVNESAVLVEYIDNTARP